MTKTGHNVIQSYLKSLDGSPGVYRMLDEKGAVLYVGKARNLKARVSSYARPTGHSPRIARMIRETASMMFLTTATETEALLLEQNLIKCKASNITITIFDSELKMNTQINNINQLKKCTKDRQCLEHP